MNNPEEFTFHCGCTYDHYDKGKFGRRACPEHGSLVSSKWVRCSECSFLMELHPNQIKTVCHICSPKAGGYAVVKKILRKQFEKYAWELPELTIINKLGYVGLKDS